jgi:SPP1 family predicted phage head-tail adaptor
MKKRYNNNQYDVDPGRLIYDFRIFDMDVVVDEGGGSTEVLTEVLATRAAKIKVSSGNQMALAAGVDTLSGDCSVLIRYRKDFELQRDQRVTLNGEKFTVLGFEPIDTPYKWWRIYLKKNAWQTT